MHFGETDLIWLMHSPTQAYIAQSLRTFSDNTPLGVGGAALAALGNNPQAAEQGGAGKEAAHDHADDGDAVKAADDDEEEDEDELVGPQLAASQAPVGSEDEGLHAAETVLPESVAGGSSVGAEEGSGKLAAVETGGSSSFNVPERASASGLKEECDGLNSRLHSVMQSETNLKLQVSDLTSEVGRLKVDNLALVSRNLALAARALPEMVNISDLQTGASNPGTGIVLSCSEASGSGVVQPGLRKVGQQTNYEPISQQGGAGNASADPGEGGLPGGQEVFAGGYVQDDLQDLAGMMKGDVGDDYDLAFL
ncbi:MAG: hypothetical protein WDW38_007462 [Sanguina aurantia]